MIKVLLISYYWPPAGGGGVQRWLKMSKYFHNMDIDLHVYTPLDGEFPGYDESLLKEVHPSIKMIKTPIWEPYKLFKIFTRKKDKNIYNAFISDGKQSVTERISVFIRGNIFIPDAKCFWIKPSIKYLHKYLIENPIDIIISTGPPHSMHLIADGLKAKHPHIKWIADFRDPWTMIDFYDKLKLTKWADKMHHKLEQRVLQHADSIVTISPSCATDLASLAHRKIEVINNGYDPEDFKNPLSESLANTFQLTHVGSMNSDRNPAVLWSVLANLKTKIGPDFDKNLSLVLIGNVDGSILQAIDKHGLTSHLTHIPKLNHDEAIIKMRTSQVLLLPINNIPQQNGILPGKMYEYMGAGRPIIAFGLSESDAAKILEETGSGKLFAYDDENELTTHIENIYADYLNGELKIASNDFRKYGRDLLSEKYKSLIKKVIETKSE
jgi:glycosyltransferase involved in cell wall biosynthesis